MRSGGGGVRTKIGELTAQGNRAARFASAAVWLVVAGCQGGAIVVHPDEPAPGDTSPVCGDGVVESIEACDDGNTQSGDGCDSECTIEAGYVCPGGAPCVVEGVCGNGLQDPDEVCDDGNVWGGDGCSADCTLASFCGDGTADAPTETCDLAAVNNGGSYDGCSADCTTLEVGYDGATPGAACAPKCGNGLVSAGEACDGSSLGGRLCTDLDGDGTPEPGDFDGGSLSYLANCQLDTAGCFGCGDGVKNGVEDCDGVGSCASGSDCGGATCEQLGFPSVTGLACTAACIYDLDGCNTTTCGNGIIDGAEMCDQTALGNKACNDLDTAATSAQ